MESIFAQMGKDAGVSAEAMDWLKSQGITSPSKFGVLAAEEKEVRAEIIDMMTAGGVKFEKLDDKAAVKMLWLACRKNMKVESQEDGGEIDAPLPKETKQDLDTVWHRVHGFTPPDAWLLVPTLQGKLWRAFNQEKPKVEPLLAEALRPLSCSNRAIGTQLAIVPGKAVETQAVMLDTVGRPIELYIRIRAWMTTMAYISVRNTAWFDFQTALFGSDKVLHLVTQTFGGQHAPTSFYVSAWAATVHYFSEHVRVSGATLKEAVLNTGAWEHRWTGFTPSGQRGDQASAGPDLPKDVQDEVNKLKGLVKQWQSTADRFRVESENLRKGGKDRGGKGKGKKHGKGKGRYVPYEDRPSGPGRRYDDRFRGDRRR